MVIGSLTPPPIFDLQWSLGCVTHTPLVSVRLCFDEGVEEAPGGGGAPHLPSLKVEVKTT